MQCQRRQMFPRPGTVFSPRKAPGLGLQFKNFLSDWKKYQTFEQYWCCSWEKLAQSAQTLQFSKVCVEC